MLGWMEVALHAHQGGWDEALILVAPVAVLGALVWVATIVAQRRADAERPTTGTDAIEGRRAAS